jgi:BON domain
MSSKTIHLLRALLGLWLILALVACSKTPSDVATSDAIKGRFYSDPQLKSENIQVAVSNGEVTLTGQVSNDAARQQAVSVAQGTEGVKKVIDQLQSPGQTAGAPSTPVQGEPLQRRQRAAGSPATVANVPASGAPPAETLAPPSQPKPPPPPPPRMFTIPEGTDVRVQMIDTIDSKTNQPGETFQASLDSPLVSGSQVVVPKGANVTVKLLEAKTSGKFKGQSELEVALDHIVLKGKSYPLSSSSVQEVGKSRGKDTAKKTGLGAAIGAGIGAIAGGGKGAAIGAGIGAGAGAGSQLFLKGKQVKIPSETKLDFKLSAPVTFTLPPKE